MLLAEIGKRIKNLRIALNMTQEELARKAGYTSRSSINKIETGLVDLPQSKIIAIAGALNTTPTYLLYGNDASSLKSIPGIYPVEVQKIPLLGNIAFGEPIYAEEKHESYIMAGADIKADFCLICQGDSMTGAGIRSGDVVFVKKQSIVNNGEIAVVLVGEEATLKRVYYYPEKSKLILNPENPRYEPLVYMKEELDDIRILGKAVAYMSYLG